jgi:organic radical activating enzyme
MIFSNVIFRSNASGNYKPDLYSVELLAQRLQTEYNVAEDHFVVTKGEPLGVQTVKIFLKALKEDSSKVKARIQEMEKQAKEITASPEYFFQTPKNCAKALAG